MMADFVNTIDLIGDEAVTKAIIEKSITEFNDDVITKVRDYAFDGCSKLASVNIPNVTSIGRNAFEMCRLVNLSLPNVKSIGHSSFRNCPQLVSVDAPNVTSLGAHSFNGCYMLPSVSFHKITSIESNTFEGCYSLNNMYFPALKTIGNSSFRVSSTSSSKTTLQSADFPSVTAIYGEAFSGQTVLTTFILRSTTLCTLINTNAFNNTPFASGKAGGTLLVPSSRVDSYKTATNWSVVIAWNANNRVLALEDYTVDGTITGEIDWEKLNGGTA